MGVDMKRFIFIAFISMVLLVAGSSPGNAFRGGHFGHGGHATGWVSLSADRYGIHGGGVRIPIIHTTLSCQ